ncbi:acyl--CoA ligase [Ancylobacter sp. MQZ15Z-1]|uniref:Acyl--CoA ligase n=1 Tax=Ancylobacter mangrovi TaxID=2972472 RepID=A0A9X2PD59_9HYPH|nr:class I adenylate-forming enzyme family protein [Ancylobacter mangrovi]MCS0496572.1 acyl--CoA ligase [Ancylobacter mangrovi]
MLTTLSKPQLAANYASGLWCDETVYALALGHAQRTPDAPAGRNSSGVVSYGELVEAADRLAADLAAAGVAPGQRVAVWMPSRIETMVALLACSRNGYVCCPSLHRNHTVAEIIELVERMHAAAVITERGYGADGDRHDFLKALEGCTGVRRVHALPPRRAGEVGERLFPAIAAGGDDLPVAQDANAVLYLAFTSGTTGRPKGVMHSANTLLANARAIVADWSIDRHSVIYTLSPLSHNLGFGAMIAALLVGAELVVHDLPARSSIAERIVETGTTFMFGVPTHAIDLLRELEARGWSEVGKLKGFRISGAAAPRDVVARLLQHGVVPQSGYGMTEAGSHHYTLPDDDPELIVSSSGRACRGFEVRIWSTENPEIEVPAGTVGQIGSRGASLMLGYFDDQSATEGSFNAQGWFMTGDLGWMDEAGYLRISGRKKDVIIRGGHNIYPARIEALAMRHRDVERVAAVPVADERLGERVCLAVMPVAGRTVTGAQMLEHLDAEGLSKFDMPEYFLLLDDIPLTASGKILKRDIIDRVRAGTLVPVSVRWQSKPATGSTGEGGTPAMAASPAQGD